mgnify:FL=1
MDVTWLTDHGSSISLVVAGCLFAFDLIYPGKIASLMPWNKSSPPAVETENDDTSHAIVDLMGKLKGDKKAVGLLNDLLRHITEGAT